MSPELEQALYLLAVDRDVGFDKVVVELRRAILEAEQYGRQVLLVRIYGVTYELTSDDRLEPPLSLPQFQRRSVLRSAKNVAQNAMRAVWEHAR